MGGEVCTSLETLLLDAGMRGDRVYKIRATARRSDGDEALQVHSNQLDTESLQRLYSAERLHARAEPGQATDQLASAPASLEAIGPKQPALGQ